MAMARSKGWDMSADSATQSYVSSRTPSYAPTRYFRLCMDQAKLNRQAFAARLLEVCDEQGLPPRGRLKQLGERFQVSYQAAKKWLEAESYPTTDTLLAIAQWGNVNVNWLLQGVGPKRGEEADERALVIAEGIDKLRDDHKREVIEYMRYNFNRSESEGWFTAEQQLRYRRVLDSFERKKS